MIDLSGANIIVGDTKIEYWIDGVESDDYSFKIWGWAIISNTPSWTVDLRLDFKGGKYNFSCKPTVVHRNDVTLINGKGYVNYDHSGFFIDIPRQNIGQDRYNVELNFRKRDSAEIVLKYPFMGIQIQ